MQFSEFLITIKLRLCLHLRALFIEPKILIPSKREPMVETFPWKVDENSSSKIVEFLILKCEPLEIRGGGGGNQTERKFQVTHVR